MTIATPTKKMNGEGRFEAAGSMTAEGLAYSHGRLRGFNNKVMGKYFQARFQSEYQAGWLDGVAEMAADHRGSGRSDNRASGR